MSLRVQTADLNLALELKLLKYVEGFRREGVSWKLSSLKDGITVEPGLYVRKADWRPLLKGLEAQGLVTRKAMKPSSYSAFKNQQTLTKYLITDKGRKVLRELGL